MSDQHLCDPTPARALATRGAPAAYTPSAGDISFYAPWGNLAIFYKDGELSSGLVRLGRLQAGLVQIASAGSAETVGIALLGE